MMTKVSNLVAALAAILLLAACASRAPAPEWRVNSFSALKGFSSAFLSGNSRLAEFEFARAKSEIASTGRADLLARTELIRCAIRVASLEFDNCAGYQALAQDAGPQERTYAAFLSGNWAELDTQLLPEHHRALVMNAAAGSPTGATKIASTLGGTEDPLTRLVVAGVLLQRSELSPTDVVLATQAASDQGWRRPLLAWLGLQFKRATDAGDFDAAARIQRRIDIVLQTPQKPQ